MNEHNFHRQSMINLLSKHTAGFFLVPVFHTAILRLKESNQNACLLFENFGYIFSFLSQSFSLIWLKKVSGQKRVVHEFIRFFKIFLFSLTQFKELRPKIDEENKPTKNLLSDVLVRLRNFIFQNFLLFKFCFSLSFQAVLKVKRNFRDIIQPVEVTPILTALA